jgi:hypothetical protein
MLKHIFKKNLSGYKLARYMSSDVTKPVDSQVASTDGLKRSIRYEAGEFRHEYDMGQPIVTNKMLQNMPQASMPGYETEITRLLKLKPGSQERTDFYYSLAEHKSEDHAQIKKAKDDIKRLIDEELEFLGYKHQLQEEEEAALVDDTYNQIEDRSSFFFKYDNKKKDKNLKIYDIMSPGNKHRKLSMVYPHEHVHPQHQIDAQSMTEDDIQQLYGLYTYYVDLHISQVRKNVDETTYIPPQFNQLVLHDTKQTDYSIDNMFFEYYHRWREPTRTWRSQTQELDHEALLASLPEDAHPDPRKLAKHEIEWTEDQKFPHVANRKGYPILADDPVERMTGIERSYAHPSYQLQAFVQTPSMDPDPTLNFEKAETIYENHRVGEWVRMWRWCVGLTLPFWPAFFTFEIYQNDGVPSLDWLSDMGSWHSAPKQFQDSGDWNLYDVRYCDEHDYMNIQYAIKRMIARPAHTMYQVAMLSLIFGMDFNYATKMVYNKDKDLVFVYKPSGVWRDSENVYEVHHLESMVPAPVQAYQHQGVGHKDGITTLTCMDTQDGIKLYNDPKYWNLELRDDFLAQTRSMWIDL